MNECSFKVSRRLIYSESLNRRIPNAQKSSLLSWKPHCIARAFSLETTSSSSSAAFEVDWDVRRGCDVRAELTSGPVPQLQGGETALSLATSSTLTSTRLCWFRSGCQKMRRWTVINWSLYQRRRFANIFSCSVGKLQAGKELLKPPPSFEKSPEGILTGWQLVSSRSSNLNRFGFNGMARPIIHPAPLTAAAGGEVAVHCEEARNGGETLKLNSKCLVRHHQFKLKKLPRRGDPSPRHESLACN